MEKFDLSVWLKDKSRKVVTRDGRPVRIICWDRLDNAERVQNILALIRNENREELQSYSEDCKGVIPSYDLFFADEEEETIDDTEMNSLAYLTELGYTCISPKEEQNAWSEEDERMLGKCIDAASVYYSLEDKQNIKDWLRAIKDRIQPQPKQDWSEEDEKMRSSTIFFLNEFKEVYKDGAQKCITWLKSLKPHWKPSEEQMNNLRATISFLTTKSILGKGMESLYNDLNKL